MFHFVLQVLLWKLYARWMPERIKYVPIYLELSECKIFTRSYKKKNLALKVRENLQQMSR